MTVEDPFNRILEKTAAPAAQQRTFAFRISLCVACILTTALGLVAAALGIKWGAAPPPGDALPYAWLYVNFMLAATWLIVWPAAALHPARLVANPSPRLRLLWDALALLAAALPALITAAFLSGITLPMATLMLALQLALCLFTMGLLFRTPPALAAGILSTLTAAAPVLAFLFAEFFPRVPQSWFPVLPLIAITRAAHAASDWPAIPPSLWWISAVYLLIGVALLIVPEQQTLNRIP